MNISESEKTSLIGESKFLVRFGDMEFGAATAVIESMSCGTPVIINTGLGTADMIKEHNAGYVLDSPDAKVVANIVRDTDVKYTTMTAFDHRGLDSISGIHMRSDNGTRFICNTVENFLSMMNIPHERMHT